LILTEVWGIQLNGDVDVVVKRLPYTFRGWLHAASGGVIELIVQRQSGLLVGASVVGPRGGEMLGMPSLAVHAGVPLEVLRSMIYAFPTFYGGIGETVGAYGRGLANVLDPDYDGFKILDGIGETALG
jgi:pyruvate/2-oxoglutarate dehydrogenase complex dihydrolipoamide dehydrogenase (E3) component